MKTSLPNSVLITGCSTGFGMETALHLAERNFRVYATMRDLTKQIELLEAAERRNVTLRILRLDITEPESIAEAVQTVVAESGGIYGVINNAGVVIRGYFEDLLEEEIRAVFEPNFFGTMAVTRAALPHMRAARRGRVVIITSIAGKIGSPGGSAYSSSRFAQEGFAESLSQELEPLGIQVVLVEPGITKTEHWTINRGVAVRATNPESPYYHWFQRGEALFHKAMDTSPIQTTDVAQTIHTALTAKQPRLRYVVGRRAGFVLALRRYIPGEIFERIYFGEIMRRITNGSW